MTPTRLLRTQIVLADSPEDEFESKKNLGLINDEEDDETFSDCIIDLFEASAIFQPIHNNGEPDPDQCAIILKSGKTVWVLTPYMRVAKIWEDLFH